MITGLLSESSDPLTPCRAVSSGLEMLGCKVLHF